MPPPESRDFGRDGDEAGDEDEEIETGNYKTQKDAILFAIDISHSMLQKPDPDNEKAEDSPAMAAIKCAYQLMQQRIISNPSDMMGVLLFGTEDSKMGDEDESKASLSYPHCYLLTDLDVPAADDVKRLRALIRNEDEAAEILVPSKEPVAMSNVLFCANQIFTTRASNFTSRRLFVVTDNDSPHGVDKEAREAAAVRAKDLYDLSVLIELFPIAQPGQDFDRSKFYDDIIYRGLPSDPEAPAPVVRAAQTLKTGDGISLLQSLISSINSRSAPRRAVFTGEFEIGPGLVIGIKGYTMIKRQEVVKSCYIWVGGDKLQIVSGTTTNVAEDTAETIDMVVAKTEGGADAPKRSVAHYEIKSAFEFGGDKIPFSKDEILAFKDFGPKILRIVGFKPLNLLPEWANCKTATFIYPDEANYIGSTRVFSALYQTLLKTQKFAFAWYNVRANTKPVLAALVPAEEKTDPDTGDQILPPGLWAIQLPFADDIRPRPTDGVNVKTAPASQELVDKMKNIISILRLPKATYDPSKYPNPSLQWFYRILQALALEEEVPTTPEDKTLPRFRQIQKRAGGSIKEWNNEMEACLAQYKEANEGKRSLEHSMRDDIALRVSKKIKTDNDVNDTGVKLRYDEGELNKLTVVQLQAFMHRKGIHASSKKKAELVSLVEDYFDRKA